MNQVELHPYLVQKELVDYCISNGIEVEAYSPLGSGNFVWLLKIEGHNNVEKAPVLLEDDTVFF